MWASLLLACYQMCREIFIGIWGDFEFFWDCWNNNNHDGEQHWWYAQKGVLLSSSVCVAAGSGDVQSYF